MANAIYNRIRSTSIQWWIPLMHSGLITFYLFYLDEGYFDLRWMHEAGNWLLFVVYIILLLPVPLAVHALLFRQYTGWRKAILDGTVSIPLTLLLCLLLFMEK